MAKNPFVEKPRFRLEGRSSVSHFFSKFQTLARRKRPGIGPNPYRNTKPGNDRVEVKIQGGLGNQLFGFAAGASLSKKLGMSLHLVVREGPKQDTKRPLNYLANLDLTPTHLTLGSDSSAGVRFLEQDFSYQSDFAAIESPMLLDGYFQSHRYFEKYSDEVKNAIRSAPQFSACNAKLPTAFLAVQIRRGDYLREQQAAFHGVLPEAYFRTGLDLLRRLVGNLHALVFSDDQQFAEYIARKLPNASPHEPTKASPHEPTKTDQDWGVLADMSRAEGFCISNSTFGWWASYLGKTDAPVVAPRPWFRAIPSSANDLLPANWITLGQDFGGEEKSTVST